MLNSAYIPLLMNKAPLLNMFPSADEESTSHKEETPSRPGQVPTSPDTLGMYSVEISHKRKQDYLLQLI